MRLKSWFVMCLCSGEKNNSTHSAVESALSEYVQKSTIHGVAYVGDDERNKFERSIKLLWWFVMLVCSVFGACFLIYQAYRTMKENPIIESPSLTRIPMWEVPFPAVSFCPDVDYDMSPFASDKTNWPDFAHRLLPDNVTELPFASALILETLLLRRSDQNNYDILSQILPTVDVEYAYFGTFPTDVEVSLQKTITEYGACATFNMYQEKDILRDGVILSTLGDATNTTKQLWSRDFGFDNHLPLANYTYPFRSFGPQDGLNVRFNVNDSKRFSEFHADIFVSFHAPDELPQYGRHSGAVFMTSGKNTFIQITPRLVASEGIEHYDPEVRQCYYSNERYLKFYKKYTQNHCELECLANYTLAQCGCVLYHLPHFNDTKLCTMASEFECFLLKRNQIFLPDLKNDDARHAPIDECKCLVSCTQLLYETVTTSTNDVGNDDNSTSFYIVNKYPLIKKNVRTELHSMSEFFANCGGSLGLFLGVSIFSIVELLYFCTVRLYLHSKRPAAISNE